MNVSVISCYYPQKKLFKPILFRYKNQEYKITKLGYHHKQKIGDDTIHTFSVVSEGTFFKLKLNGTNLIWSLEEIYDPT